MSEQPAAPPPGAKKPPGKKYAGLSRNQWLIVGGVFAVAVGYLLWKRHEASQQAAQSGTSGTVNQGSDECTDANGNPVDCGELTAQELAAVQNQLDQLQGQGYGGGSSGGGGGYWSGGTGATGTTTGTDTGTTTTTATAAGTPTSSSGATSTGTTKTAAKTAGAISNLSASAVTKTSFKASWQAASNATGYSYAVRDLASHTQVTAGTTKATSVTISGLKSGTDYNFGIQALPGGAGNNIHVRTS